MPSNERSDLLDLEKGLPTTPADVLALRRLRLPRTVSTADYLRFLALLGPARPEHLRARRGPHGREPFRL